MRILRPRFNIRENFYAFNLQPPDAYALIKGGPLAPYIRGQVFFYQLKDGVYIRAYITGIPEVTSSGSPSTFHGFHIHEFGSCLVGNEKNPFTEAGGHWNPEKKPHPFHPGDLPPLLSTNGIAMMTVYTPNFLVNDVIGKSLIIHEGVDDFTTQPAGNSGPRLACGMINPSSNANTGPQPRYT
ncbi:MAG: superoxide dismutase family protein [Clostridium sp.]